MILDQVSIYPINNEYPLHADDTINLKSIKFNSNNEIAETFGDEKFLLPGRIELRTLENSGFLLNSRVDYFGVEILNILCKMRYENEELFLTHILN